MRFKIIDAHTHLGPSIQRMVPDHSAKARLEQMDRLGIERAISAERYSMKGQYEAGLAEDAAARELSKGRFFSFCGYVTSSTDAAIASIRAHKNDPQCVGIKIHPAGTKTHADDEAFRPCWEVAREVNKPIMAHTWDVSSYNPSQVYAVAGKFEKWLAEYPDVNFVFGHSGGRYNGIKTAIALGKKYPNAYFDIAGDIWYNGFLETLVEGVGEDRVIFGSDNTMIEPRPVLGIVYGANISNRAKEKILYHNAARVYFKEE